MEQKELQAILEEHTKWLESRNGKRADLPGADLSGTNLSRADLSGADLSGTNLSRANLTYANLTYADLSGADLSGVNLSRANLTYADLSGADLSGVNLSRANLSEVIGCDVISIQMNTSVKNRQIQYIPEIDRCIVGCFDGTLEELKMAVVETHKNNLKIKNRYMKAIKFIEELVKEYEGEK